MTSPRRLPLALVLLVAAAFLLAGPVGSASAYVKPPGGKWNIQDKFDYTQGGAMKLSADGAKVTKLVLIVGEDWVEDCGASRVRLSGQLAVKTFPKAGGRWAVAKQPGGGLLKAVRAKFKLGGQTVTGTVLLLWDHTGRLADTGTVEVGDCRLQFAARKAAR